MTPPSLRQNSPVMPRPLSGCRTNGWPKPGPEYAKDGNVTDTSPPPAPNEVQRAGNILTWSAEADFESGIAGFIIERDGRELARVPEKPAGSIGRQIFQKNGYSDTPTPPLAAMRFRDITAKEGENHDYQVITVNSVGSQSVRSQRAKLLHDGVDL